LICSFVNIIIATNIKPNANNLEIRGAIRPQLNDPSLLSTWSHRACVACGFTMVLVSLAKSIIGAANSHMWLEPILAGSVGYVLADLGSGIYHWGTDNYGSALTPIVGAQIEAFQDVVCDDPIVHGLVAVCSDSIMFRQQFHAWNHGMKSQLPPVVVALQDLGILVSRSQHAAHHRKPYNNNYCIVSGVWNGFLDKHKVFEALEMMLFLKQGVRPRSWSEPTSEWTEESESS
ncbi:unnamed protein product, partial [Prunus brigantina]